MEKKNSGHERVIKVLARHNARLDVTDYTLQTALHVASALGHYKCVEVLIDYGANINAEDRMKKTPLHLASNLGFGFEIES